MNTQAMTEKLHDVRHRATETARNVSTKADHYVRENTWASVGIAVALGCLLGFLLAHRGED
jgi:ElaB/YqjD/DUF883 family membrane-anchored ribosome-binding protein